MIYAIITCGYLLLCAGCWILLASGKLKRFSVYEIIQAESARTEDAELRALILAEFEKMEREKEWLR